MASWDLTKPLFITGTLLSSWLSGNIFNISLLAIPATLSLRQPGSPPASAHTLLHLWNYVYQNGKAMAPPLALGAALAHFGNAYILYRPAAPSQSWRFIAAGLTGLCIVPWTFATMNGVNARLEELLSLEQRGGTTAGKGNSGFGLDDDIKVDVDNEGEARELISKWSKLNMVRSVFPLLGAVLAFEAL